MTILAVLENEQAIPPLNTMMAKLQPDAELKKAQDEGDFTRRLVLMEEAKTLPFGAVWEEYCRRTGVPADGAWFDGVRAYERDVLLKRN